MNCEQMPWAEVLAGSLSKVDRDRIDDHLASCAGCRGERARWAELVAAGAAVGPSSRLGCPSPDALLEAETAGGEPWVTSHLASCGACRAELDAVREGEEGVDAVAVPLPARLAEALSGGGGEPFSDLARELLSLVRARVGGEGGVLDGWRRGLTRLVADTRSGAWSEAPSFAAPGDKVAEGVAGQPVEVSVRTGEVDLEVHLDGPWVRVRAHRGAEPVQGVTVRLTNELGEVVVTETDTRGEARAADDLPGRRKIRVGR